MTKWLNFIDKIIYINLDRRVDRKREIEEQFTRLKIPSDKIIRFPAIPHQSGNVGCNMSHAAVLRLAHDLNLNNVLILEDDFNFIKDSDLVNSSLDEFVTLVENSLKWDACLLINYAQITNKYNDLISRYIKSSNAAGYLVNKHLFLNLSQTIHEAAEPLGRTGEHWNYQNDVVWCKYMATGDWFVFNKSIGYQRISYSDLSQQVIDNSGGVE